MSSRAKRRYADTVTDLSALSRYLEAMAAEGLMVNAIDLPDILFEKCLPKKVRFNAVVVSDMSEADVMGYVSLCRETGWDLACRYSELFVFVTEDLGIPDIDTEKDAPVRIEKRKKRWGWKRILYLLIPAAAALTLLIAAVMAKSCADGCAGSSRSLEDADYWWEDEPCDRLVSQYSFKMMPVRSGGAVINDYLFYWYPTLLDDSVELFIDCTYSEEDYAREVKRLLSVDFCRITAESPTGEAAYGDGTLLQDEGFAVPAIVGVLKRGEGAEYALLYESEHRIVYVYLQWWPRYRLDIDGKYLPTDKRFYHYAP